MSGRALTIMRGRRRSSIDAAGGTGLTDEHIRVPGLSAPGSITVDRNGIPHIRATNRTDLFFLQGFNAARDRLWQIDLWRKRGLGLLAADFGPGYLEQDKAARLFLYRGGMDAEYAAYGPETRAICAAFVAGINAYVDLTAREPRRLPPEFGLMGTTPARWASEDVLRIRSHGLTRNALSEVARLAVLGQADAATDRLRKMVEPPTAVATAPGVPAGSLPIACLDAFRLAQAPVTFSPERLACPRAEAGAWSKADDAGTILRDAEWTGSNNWAVTAARSGTGAPVLASDPHRAHSVPSLRYLVHLTCPDLDVIGAGEPTSPGVCIGHNGHAAFGLTIFCADQEDVYVAETDPADPERYRFGGGFERMAIVEETIPVKGGPDEPVRMAFTRQGAVLWRDAERRKAVIVRSVWSAPGSAPYMQSLSMMGAASLDAFRTGAKRWGAPSVNQVYADKGGTVAWLACGFVPKRRWSGLLPVPADGSHEWDGFLDPALLPEIVDPAEGFVATANEMNLPEDWPHADRPVSHEWTEPSRARRIREVLGRGNRHGVAEACALQTDVTSLPARRAVALLARLSPDEADARAALALLAGWDHRLEAGSAAAALFEVWWTHHLRPALFALHAPEEALRRLMPPGDVEGLLQAIEAPGPAFGKDRAGRRDRLLLDTLASAFRDVRGRLGPDAGAWAWGRLHHGFFEHALSTAGAAPAWNAGPLPKGGSASTPMHTGYRPSDFRITHGASFRMVVDLADLDRSVCMNAPGQSGDPRSKHYADLAPEWAAGRYVPMPYSEAAVAAAAETVIRLSP